VTERDLRNPRKQKPRKSRGFFLVQQQNLQ
jgi:hypothetical protein